MFRIAFILLGLFLLFGGLNDAYNGWKQPEPARLKVAEFIGSDHSADWVVLTDAKLNLLKAVMVAKGEGGKIKQLYIPIESDKFFQKDKVSLLLDTKDKELIAIANEMRAMSEGEQLKYIVQNRDRLLREGEISGTMSSKAVMNSERVAEVNGLIKNLDGEFFILSHGADVNLKRGLIIAGVALVILVLAFRRKKKVIPKTPEAPEAA